MDTEPPEELNPDSQRQQLGEFVSKPNFKVELVHNKTTFTIVCSFNEPDQEEIEQGYSMLTCHPLTLFANIKWFYCR